MSERRDSDAGQKYKLSRVYIPQRKTVKVEWSAGGRGKADYAVNIQCMEIKTERVVCLYYEGEGRKQERNGERGKAVYGMNEEPLYC